MKILLSILTAFFIVGCSQDTENETKSVEEKVVEKSVMQKATEVVTEVKAEVEEKTAAVVTKVEGGALYTKCASCHGLNGEKMALGKSAVIADWSVEQIQNALHGYKDGTFGGPMKGMMKAQVANLSDEEIKAISEYIAK